MNSLVERPRSAQETEQDTRSKKAYIVIAGGLGADAGMVGIRNAVHEVTKSEHVSVFNSEMSMDPVNKDRYEQQSKFIKENLEAGKEVEVITHSIGAIEACRDVVEIMRQDREFFDNPERANKLTLNLTAPAGLEQSRWDQLKFAVNYFRLGGPRNMAVNAATAYPPQNMEPEEFAENVRTVFRRKKPITMPAIPFAPQDDYYDPLDPEKRKKLDNIDIRMKKNMEKGRRWRSRRNLKQRSRVVKKELQNVFEGKYVEGNTLYAPRVSFPHLIGRPEVRNLIKEMHTDSVYRTIAFLISKGVNIKVSAYDHDMAVTLDSIDRFIQQTSTSENRAETQYIGMIGHSGLSLQPHYWADAVTKYDVNKLAEMRRKKEAGK